MVERYRPYIIMIEIKVNEQNISVDEILTEAAQTIQYESCHFTIEGESWESLDNYSAIFENKTSGVQVAVILNSTRTCYIPWEVLTERGKIYVNLAGFNAEMVSQEETITYRITTFQKQIIKLIDTLVEAEGTTSPTPSVWEQFVAQVSADKTAAQTAKTQAEGFATQASNSATSASNSATSASGSATSASGYADNASGSATSASNSATSASNSATSASNSATSASNSATSASTSATNAEASRQAIEDMTVSSSTLSAGSSATVTKTEVGGVVNLAFGIPKGDKGDDGEDGSIVSVSASGTSTDEVKYITIDGVEKKLAGGDEAVWGSITGTLSNQSDLQTALNAKANTSTTYTKSEVDTALSGKASSVHTHTKSQITDFPSIPTKTSDLTNDSGFLTQHQSLADYSTTTQMNTAISNHHDSSKQDALPTVTNDRYLHTNASTGALEWSTVSSSTDWDDITNKPTKFNPDIVGLEDFSSVIGTSTFPVYHPGIVRSNVKISYNNLVTQMADSIQRMYQFEISSSDMSQLVSGLPFPIDDSSLRDVLRLGYEVRLYVYGAEGLNLTPEGTSQSGGYSTVYSCTYYNGTVQKRLRGLYVEESDGYETTYTLTLTEVSSGGGQWGSITGTLSNQTDLQTALDGKESTSNKVTSVSSASTDTEYPSAKCVYDMCGNIESLLLALL